MYGKSMVVLRGMDSGKNEEKRTMGLWPQCAAFGGFGLWCLGRSWL
jgi:hypothetical protein